MDVDKPLKVIVPLCLREPCSRGRTSLWCAHCALLRNILRNIDRTRVHAPTPPGGGHPDCLGGGCRNVAAQEGNRGRPWREAAAPREFPLYQMKPSGPKPASGTASACGPLKSQRRAPLCPHRRNTRRLSCKGVGVQRTFRKEDGVPPNLSAGGLLGSGGCLLALHFVSSSLVRVDPYTGVARKPGLIERRDLAPAPWHGCLWLGCQPLADTEGGFRGSLG